MLRGPRPGAVRVDRGGSGDGRACSGSVLLGRRSRRNTARSALLAYGHTGCTGGIALIAHNMLLSRRTCFPATMRHETDQPVVWPGSGKQGAAASGRVPDRQRSVCAPFDADRVRHGW